MLNLLPPCAPPPSAPEWLQAKAKRLSVEDKQQQGLAKAMQTELEWMGRKAKGQQKKGAARMRRWGGGCRRGRSR